MDSKEAKRLGDFYAAKGMQPTADTWYRVAREEARDQAIRTGGPLVSCTDEIAEAFGIPDSLRVK
jgi:hypothetical protein